MFEVAPQSAITPSHPTLLAAFRRLDALAVAHRYTRLHSAALGCSRRSCFLRTCRTNAALIRSHTPSRVHIHKYVWTVFHGGNVFGSLEVGAFHFWEFCAPI